MLGCRPAGPAMGQADGEINGFIFDVHQFGKANAAVFQHSSGCICVVETGDDHCGWVSGKECGTCPAIDPHGRHGS